MPTEGLGEAKKLHPFFTKSDAAVQQTPTPTDSQILQETSAQTPGISHRREEDHEERGFKRRKTNSDGDAATPPLKQLSREGKVPRPPSTHLISDSFKPVISPSVGTLATIQNRRPAQTPTPPVSEEPDGGTPVAPEQGQQTPAAASSRPKRVLKLDLKTGTFGSPPKPNPTKEAAAKAGQRATFIVCIFFGTDVESRKRIGAKIEGILGKGPSVVSAPTPVPKKRGRPSKADRARKALLDAQAESPKTTQTLVADKTKAGPTKPPNAQRATLLSSTPCSPKKARSTFRSGNFPQFGAKNVGLRVPGAAHPAWPTKENTHVTGIEQSNGASNAAQHLSTLPWRKSKGRPAVISPQESVLQQLSDTLAVALSRTLEECLEASELRLPIKHFETGLRLQSRIRPQLRTPLPANRIVTNDESDEDIITSTRDRSHPAISRLYNSLVTNLSAHDRSECEDISWAQKYAPETAAEVLQSGREALMLRDWLEALKVQAVDTGPSTDAKSAATKPTLAVKKKRKRAKLDDFIVNSDDDIYEPDDMTDPEDNSPGQPLQTVVQNGGNIPPPGKDAVRLSNVSLLSGPNGSGKTATVYAIAKELGFEVFEINASTRRSGKDIVEKVGDMTRNHLVQGHNEDSGGKDKAPKEVKKGSVMSFFKPKKTDQATATQPPEDPPNEAASEQPAHAKTRTQKQSLILLEEVDLLYEEDKQFWATITGLIAQSKRPFIMTCNDESAVPFQTLNLYGIFRFSPPPQDLAIDYLLLAAANEGHALRRPAVQSLLESRNGDLRAAFAELNYWCQLGVGDRRGGFDWFYPRWPRGCDKDENGNVVRVISENTYLEGMGWLGRDSVAVDDPLGTEDELVSQCWDGFQMDMTDWHKTRSMDHWATELLATGLRRGDLLATYESFSDSMSTADMISQGRLGLGLQDNLDTCHPLIPVKARDDFVLGRKLLEAPLLVEYQPVSRDTSFAIRSRARALAQAASTEPSCMTEIDMPDALRLIRGSFAADASGGPITRMDMAHAFDPIAVSDQRSIVSASHLDPSVFDRTMKLITLEVAPFVRGIVSYDRHVAEGRIQRGTLISEGARPGKRLRQTRTSADAAGLRREGHFRARVNPYLVLRTGGQWEQAVTEVMDAQVVEVVPQAKEEEVVAVQYAVPAPPMGDNTIGGRFVQIQPRPGMV